MGVYDPSYSREKEDFSVELGDIRGLWDDPWCVDRGFNMVRLLGDGKNKNGLTTSMRCFSEIIEDLNCRIFC